MQLSCIWWPLCCCHNLACSPPYQTGLQVRASHLGFVVCDGPRCGSGNKLGLPRLAATGWWTLTRHWATFILKGRRSRVSGCRPSLCPAYTPTNCWRQPGQRHVWSFLRSTFSTEFQYGTDWQVDQAGQRHPLLHCRAWSPLDGTLSQIWPPLYFIHCANTNKVGSHDDWSIIIPFDQCHPPIMAYGFIIVTSPPFSPSLCQAVEEAILIGSSRSNQ